MPYTHAKRNRALSVFLALILTLSAMASGIFPAAASDDGVIRVKLTRVGTPDSLSFLTSCDYFINGSAAARIPSGTQVTLRTSGGALFLSFSGTSYSVGSSITLIRGTKGAVGATFTDPSLSNVYCGDLKFVAGATSIAAYLSVYVEDYLYGVVGYEMSNSWPIEALKAQAITARTYAMRKKAQRTGYTYDLTDNTNDQVFRGYNASYGNVKLAVDETRGMVVQYGSALAQCYYSASNGGQTESTKNAWGGALAYSTVRDDPYDLASSGTKKSATLKKDGTGLSPLLLSALKEGMRATLIGYGLSGQPEDISIDAILSVTPNSPRFASPSLLYQSLTFHVEVTVGSKGGMLDVEIPTYGAFEDWYSLSINSADNETVTVTETDDAFVITFRRWGHGVGMSQCGAYVMAKSHSMTYNQILDFYYPGTTANALSLEDSTGGIGGGAPLIPDVTSEPTTPPPPTVTPIPESALKCMVALSGADQSTYLYSAKSTSSVKTATLTHGSEVYVTSYDKTWAYCAYGSAQGYVMLSKILQYARDMYAQVTNSTGLSAYPGTSGASVPVSVGEYLSVLAYNGSVAYCEDGAGNRGFVQTKYLKKVTTPASTASPAPTASPAATVLPTATIPPGSTLPPLETATPPVESTIPPIDSTEPPAATATPTVPPAATAKPTATPAATAKPTATPAPPAAKSIPAIVSLPSGGSMTYVYAESNTASERMGTLTHGDIVTVYRYSGAWAYGKSEDSLGCIRLSYLMRRPSGDMYVMFTTSGMLFEYVNPQARRTVTVIAGDYAKVIAYNGKAAYVEMRSGAKGFVATKYLRKVPASETGGW